MDDNQSAASVGSDESQSLDTTAPVDGQVAGEGQNGGVNAENEQQTVVPESYEFTMPEGMQLNEELAANANLAFKDIGLSQDQSDKVTQLYVQEQQRQVDQFNQQLQDWADQSRNDPEFGGEKFNENIAIANSYFSQLNPALKDVLTAYGLNNHPEVIREMLKHGRPMQEDQPGSGNAPNPIKSRIDKLYPNS